MQYLDKTKGCARQGDVLIWPLPEGFTVSRTEEIAAQNGRIVLLHGEATGHHHSIGVKLPMPTMFRDDGAGAGAVDVGVGTATLYADAVLLRALVAAGQLVTTDLCVGFLIVADASVIVEHQEHDAISIPPGAYYVGRQREFRGEAFSYVQD
jgi:hypothetical protein